MMHSEVLSLRDAAFFHSFLIRVLPPSGSGGPSCASPLRAPGESPPGLGPARPGPVPARRDGAIWWPLGGAAPASGWRAGRGAAAGTGAKGGFLRGSAASGSGRGERERAPRCAAGVFTLLFSGGKCDSLPLRVPASAALSPPIQINTREAPHPTPL